MKPTSDALMMHCNKSNTFSTRNSSLLIASATAALIFMSSFIVIMPNVLQTAAAVALPTGEWEIHENGYIGTLRIDSVDAQGVVTGTLEVPPDPSHTITGLYNERTGTLTFYRIINQQDPSSIQVFVGIVFRDGSPFAGTPDRLAGYFMGLPAGGGNMDQNVWGWYASLTSAAQESLSSEQAEEPMSNATDLTARGPIPDPIIPDNGTINTFENCRIDSTCPPAIGPDPVITPPPEGANMTLGGMNATDLKASVILDPILGTNRTEPDDIVQGGDFFGQPTPP